MGFSLPSSFAFADGTCVCTTKDTDCRAVSLSVSQQSTNSCKEVCVKDVGKSFASSEFADGTEGEILASSCQKKHNAFLASKTDSSSDTSASKLLLPPRPQSSTFPFQVSPFQKPSQRPHL